MGHNICRNLVSFAREVAPAKIDIAQAPSAPIAREFNINHQGAGGFMRRIGRCSSPTGMLSSTAEKVLYCLSVKVGTSSRSVSNAP